MKIRELNSTDNTIVANTSTCAINKIIRIANKSDMHKSALINHYVSESKKCKHGTTGYGPAQDYLRHLLFENHAKTLPTTENIFQIFIVFRRVQPQVAPENNFLFGDQYSYSKQFNLIPGLFCDKWRGFWCFFATRGAACGVGTFFRKTTTINTGWRYPSDAIKKYRPKEAYKGFPTNSRRKPFFRDAPHLYPQKTTRRTT